MDLRKINDSLTYKEFRYNFLQWCKDEIEPLEDLVDDMFRVVQKQEQEIASLKNLILQREERIPPTVEREVPIDENKVIIK